MVQGIFSSLTFPLANFPTKGAKATDLFDLLWQGIEYLEMDDFKVMFLTSESICVSLAHCKPVSNLSTKLVYYLHAGDGAGPNRRFYKMHGTERGGTVYKTTNPFSEVDDAGSQRAI